jgi:hypothetical protein
MDGAITSLVNINASELFAVHMAFIRGAAARVREAYSPA